MATRHIRFDWAIKRLLRNKANYVVLEGFLSELLHTQIKIQTLLERVGNQQTEEDKSNRVDILAETENSELVLIEVQNNSQLDYFHRMLYGVSQLVTEYLEQGEEYGKIRKIYSVNIVYFNLGKEDDYIYRFRSEFMGVNQGDILEASLAQERKYTIEKVADIFPEYYLLKVKNFKGIAKNHLEEWIYYLKNSEIKEEFEAKGMVEAKETLRVNNLSDQERAAYKRYMDNKSYEASILSTQEFEAQWQIEQIEQAEIRGRLEGLEEGREEGRLEGLEEGKRILLLEQLERRFPEIASQHRAAILGLNSQELDNLADAMWDFQTSADLLDWLQEHSS
ncbi:MAG: Rpn family recombination-promoting nuclease/putative transposase [Moorea sp. SIO4A1]|uniref:Rpn family recombination-promoting nuclease/putative transposase n=1 Tax=Moorena sp. SIO4A1 TaxID=2607835 RepID=UPI00144E39D2|nr:Rpn family recombination-promoting nuclease/putative transposase [Moorena sp. SIO4A1]NEQ58676.1 Rpn family recombination-promoting nuclease/putative transposase [Moorena sp. SIO4A1]